MEAAVQYYFERGLAPSTRKAYGTGIRKFIHFCTLFHVCNPLPVSPQLLCYYSAYLATLGLAPSTIKSYLAAVRHLQIAEGFPEPGQYASLAKLRLVATGIQKEASRPPHIRLPADQDTIMLWAACCIAFFGFFRIGELTTPSDNSFDPRVHLSFGELAIVNPQNPSAVRIHLKQSKTDQLRKGIDVFVGRTNDDLCPVAAMLAYVAVRGGGPGPLFRFRNGKPLTRDRFVTRVRQALQSLGLAGRDYSGHSFRIGAATTAAARGIPNSTIQRLGRWRSNAFLGYIQTPPVSLAPMSQTLASGLPPN